MGEQEEKKRFLVLGNVGPTPIVANGDLGEILESLGVKHIFSEAKPFEPRSEPDEESFEE